MQRRLLYLQARRAEGAHGPWQLASLMRWLAQQRICRWSLPEYRDMLRDYLLPLVDRFVVKFRGCGGAVQILSDKQVKYPGLVALPHQYAALHTSQQKLLRFH
jgi:hypothetical protein